MKVFPTNALSNGSTFNTDEAKPQKFSLHLDQIKPQIFSFAYFFVYGIFI